MKTPSKKTVLETAALAGGVVAGAMGSRAAFGAIHEDTSATGNNVAKYGKRLGIIALAAAGAFFIPGENAGSKGLKGLCIGAAAVQLLDAGADYFSTNETTSALASGNKLQKIAARGLGLQGCPGGCSHSHGMGRPRSYGRGRLSMPIEIPGELHAAPANRWEQKFLEAGQKAAA